MLNTSTDIDDNDFVLKHRIAGAAFLLFFGALVLPWLLGPPSEAEEVSEVLQIDATTSEEYIPEDLENEILAQLQEEVVDDETVYISKVTPTGFVKVSETNEKNKAAEKAKLEKEKAEKIAAQKQAEKQKEQAKLEQENAAKKKQALAKAQETKNKAEKEKKRLADKRAQTLAALDAKTNTTQLAESERAKIAAKQLADALEAESKSNKITSGWIVQVGVFTDKAGANKVSDSLNQKGFKPSLTVVDTNLGIGTGSRVWLGPFSSRDEANKVKVSLASKTGSSGFVRAYP